MSLSVLAFFSIFDIGDHWLCIRYREGQPTLLNVKEIHIGRFHVWMGSNIISKKLQSSSRRQNFIEDCL